MTATYEARRRARLLDGIRALAIDASAEVEAERLTCPLTTPRPARAFAGEDEPIYRELVAELGIPGLGDWPTGHPVLRGEIEPPTMPLRLAAVGA